MKIEFWLAAAAVGCLVWSPSAAAEPSLEQGIKNHLGYLTDNDLPGIAVLVARDGQVVYQGGFGLADIEAKSPVTPETKFRIGSVSKQFTAAAVLRLADEGKLSLDDRLEKYFPGFPGADAITLHQLLTHTSGIHSYTSKPEFMARVATAVTPEDLVAFFRDDPQDFAPGEKFLYNNSGYFLAGEIVAKVSGRSLDAFLREAFFEPLGMKDTGVFVNAAPPPGVARGYAMAEGKATAALDWDMSWAGGAGALYSTVGDLFRWNEALFGGKVLKPETFALMTTAAKLPPGAEMSYGYGVVVSTLRRLPSVGHGGGLNGWSSDLLRLPDQRCTVVALANALPPVPGHEPGSVTRRLAEKVLEAEIKALPPMEEDPHVDKATYAALAGRYDYKNAVMTVTVEDGRLHAQLTGQPKFEIFPSAPDAFFWKVTDAEVVFLRDEKNAVTAARHTQSGNTFTAPRLAEATVTLTSEELEAIVGSYQYGPAVLIVTRDGEAVFAQLTGQQKFQIHPKSATEFEWRVVPASVVFVKDEDGKVTKAVHTQNGRSFDAPKLPAKP
jgi:CubicO group peptidase (beta-lactamase class C family)